MSSEYLLPKNGANLFRLTLSPQAFALALSKNSPWAGFAANKRKDGKWDVCIRIASANLLKQIALPKENLSDTVVRHLSPPAGKSAKTGGQNGT